MYSRLLELNDYEKYISVNKSHTLKVRVEQLMN